MKLRQSKFPLIKISLLIGSIICCSNLAVYAADQQLVDRVVAVVNQEAITQSELDRVFYPIREQLIEAYQGSELTAKLEETYKKLLNQLIEDRLVLQAAKKLGVEVTDQEINERFEEFKKEFPPNENFQAALESQGLTVKAVKDRIRDQFLIQRLQYVEVQRKVVVSPAEIDKFYEENGHLFVQKEKVKVWAISIPKSEEAIRKGMMDEAAKKEAASILEQVKKGKDFSELAKQKSRDSHAKDGGLIGYIARGDMIGPIDEVLFRLPAGGVSEIMETERAYHIFKVGDRQPAKSLTLEEARDKIHEVLFRKKANARFEAWMEELKKTAYISIR